MARSAPWRIPAFGRRRAQQLGATARTVAQPAPETLTVVRSAQPAALTIARLAAVVTGVLVAIALSDLVGFTWWSLGLTIVAALVLGYLLHLGDTVLEMPISDPLGGRHQGRGGHRADRRDAGRRGRRAAGRAGAGRPAGAARA